MTPQSTNTDDHSTVPAPELNPMLNPLLAKNMGRWAEVYFTHPSEERERAVQELVRQLEQENREREAQISSFPALGGTEPDEANVRHTAERTAVVCGGCGHENSVSQRFCGMCGVTLAPVPNVSVERTPPTSVGPKMDEEAWAETEDVEPDVRPDVREDRQHYFLEPRSREREYESEVEPPMFASAEPSFSYSYRIFLGLALAIVLGVLGYMAWHKGQTLSQEGPQAAPPAVDQAANADQQANQKSAEGTNQATAAPTKTQDATAKAPKAEKAANEPVPDNSPAAAPKAGEASSATEPARANKPALTPAARTERIPSNANGAEELATAQRYLNGESGQRDPSQAAQWLWRSVAKQNSQATLMLADLYLHGDGIQKNCDQARILLDAAAGKGQPGAATRLRNMQTYGCQ